MAGRRGKTQPLLAKPGVYGRPSLSPDGQRLAVDVTEGSGTDIWVYDWQRDTMTRLTFSRNSYLATRVESRTAGTSLFAAPGEGMFWTRADGAASRNH